MLPVEIEALSTSIEALRCGISQDLEPFFFLRIYVEQQSSLFGALPGTEGKEGVPGGNVTAVDD